MKSTPLTDSIYNRYAVTYSDYKGGYNIIEVRALGFSHIADRLQQQIGFVPDVIKVTKLNS